MFHIIERNDSDTAGNGISVITINDQHGKCWTVISLADGWDRLVNPFGQIFDVSHDWGHMPIAAQELMHWFSNNI